ncbi:MAG: ABC transporter ATP-binding protein [Candidatus Thorarchaeota archaeon]
MGFLFHGLEAKDFQRQYTDRELIKRFLKRVGPFKLQISIIFLFILLQTVVVLLSPLLLGATVNELSRGSDAEENKLLALACLYLCAYVLIWIFNFGIQWTMAYFVPQYMQDLRMEIFWSLQKQDMKFFDQRESARLTTRVANDASDFGSTLFVITFGFENILVVILSFAILLMLSVPLTLMSLLLIPSILVVSLFFRKLAHATNKSYRRAVAAVNASMAQSIEGIQIAKSFGQEAYSLGKFCEVNQRHFEAGFRRNIVMGSLFPTLDLLTGLVLVGLIFFGGTGVIEGSGLSAGDLYVFILYLQRFFFPIMVLTTLYTQFHAGMAAYERILDILDTRPEVQQIGSFDSPSESGGEIAFKNVDFSYVEGQPVFSNFSIHIPTGENLAVVGHTGAGKTSLIGILQRFYEFQGGQILIDGVDIREYSLETLRYRLGTVQQEPFLFSGTVRENILYGRRDATEEDLLRAIRVVHADEFINYLPQGLNSPVGERGSLLSTGQRQLVAFARALLANPRILILDEATSSVDAYTEAVIQEALESLMKGRTSIVIAHRLSTIKNADRIIVLENGRIVEEGNHDLLMEKKGKYYQLYSTYFKHQSLDWKPELPAPAVEEVA